MFKGVCLLVKTKPTLSMTFLEKFPLGTHRAMYSKLHLSRLMPCVRLVVAQSIAWAGRGRHKNPTWKERETTTTNKTNSSGRGYHGRQGQAACNDLNISKAGMGQAKQTHSQLEGYRSY